MGSNRSKPRKKKGKQQHPQHLPKVGTPAENQRLQHAEREAVLDNMGMGGASHTTRIVLGVIVALIVIGAIFSLLAFNTFH